MPSSPRPSGEISSMLITNLTELFSRIALRVRAERFRRHESWIVGFCYGSISFLSIAMGPPILNFPMAVYTVIYTLAPH
jgi:hypothetical protein